MKPALHSRTRDKLVLINDIDDDEPMVRWSLAQAFRAQGFEIIETGTAAQAMRLIRTRPGIQLLITDIRLPGELDGLDLAYWVVANHPDVRVMIVSSYPEDLIASSDPDSYAFLSRPVSPAALIRKARAILGIGRLQPN